MFNRRSKTQDFWEKITKLTFKSLIYFYLFRIVTKNMSCQLDEFQTRKAKLKQNICKSSGKLIPFIKWISSYSMIDAIADFIAGFTIGLILIPQSVAYLAIVQLSAKVSYIFSCIFARTIKWLKHLFSSSRLLLGQWQIQSTVLGKRDS